MAGRFLHVGPAQAEASKRRRFPVFTCHTRVTHTHTSPVVFIVVCRCSALQWSAVVCRGLQWSLWVSAVLPHMGQLKPSW